MDTCGIGGAAADNAAAHSTTDGAAGIKATGPDAEAHPATWTIANEFAQVRVSLVRTRNGTRLRIHDPVGGRAVDLCPLQLEALTWQDPEVFSGFLTTPFGPEAAGSLIATPAKSPDAVDATGDG